MPKFILTVLVFLLSAGLLEASPLSLEQALQLAKKQNPTLRSSTLHQDIAAENVRQARSSYLPRLDANGAYTIQNEAQAFLTPTGSSPTQNDDYSHVDVSAEQTLYDFGRTAGRYQRAKALKKATVYDYAALEQNIFLHTVTAYYLILKTQKMLAAARQEVAQRADHLRQAQALYEEGVVNRNDVLQAEVELAGSRQRLLLQENRLKNNWLQLNYLTGRPPQTRNELEEHNLTRQANLRSSPGALKERPDLKAQRQIVAAGQEQLKQAKADFCPVLFIRGEANYTQNDYVKEQTIYSAILGLRINLFNGLASTSRYRAAAASLRQDRRVLEDMQEQARLEYESALNDADVALRRIEAAKKAVEQGEENLRINRDRYREQTGTAIEVVDAQTLLTRTRTDYFTALFDYQVALTRVKKAVGAL